MRIWGEGVTHMLVILALRRLKQGSELQANLGYIARPSLKTIKICGGLGIQLSSRVLAQYA
jgi:hypothetical protein